MKSKICLYILAVLFCASSIKVWSQEITTMGTDFWFSFMKGRMEASMTVTVTGSRACSGTLSNPNTGWTQNFTVPANGSVIINIDTAQSYNYVSNRICNKGLHLTTTDTVSVYASNFLQTSFDVSYVLPTDALGDEYMVQTFESCHASDKSEVLIVAVENNTVVDIYTTTAVLNHTGSSVITKTLNAGQCYLMQNNVNTDFSGTTIKSHNCKPFAVFNGHVCAHIPSASGSACDHLYEQSLPTRYWGKRFVATMANGHNGDIVKITSLYDDCAVNVGGGQVATLDAGESYSFSMTGSQHSRYIETSKPSTVYMYTMSVNVAGPNGDPSMSFIPPIEQRLKDVVFVSYNYATQLTSAHYVNVVASSSDINDIYLDGTSLVNSFSAVPDNPYYSFARVPVAPGSHRLRSFGNDGFVAYASGVGGNESYGYAVGFSTIPQECKLYVNDVEVGDGDTVHVCVGDDVRSFVYFNDTADIIGWFKDGVPFSANDTLTFSSSVADSSAISVVFTLLSDCSVIIDTFNFYTIYSGTQTNEFDSVVCNSLMIWNGIHCDSSGRYQCVLPDVYGCDSLVIMNLTINEGSRGYLLFEGCDSIIINDTPYYEDDTIHYSTYIDQNGCDSVVFACLSIHPSSSDYVFLEGCDSIIIHNIPYYENDTVYYSTYIDHNGCDSVKYACLTIHPSYMTNVDVDLTEGDTLLWIDGASYYNEESHPVYYYQSVDGCDSALRLNIHVIYLPPPPPIDSSVVWAPNAFTPNESSNNVFKVFGDDLISMHVWVYNRWGDYVTDFDGLTEGWDGTRDGKPCKAETYVYLIEYSVKAFPRIIKKITGTITLLK